MLTSPDKLIRAVTSAVVVAVAAFAAVISYTHIDHLAVTHGQTQLAALLLPLSVDGLILAASMVLLQEARAGRPAPSLARWMLWLGIAGTVGANVAYGAAYGPLGAIISAWPAVAFIGSAGLLMGMIRRARLDVPAAVPAEVPATLPAERAEAQPEHKPAAPAEAQRPRARKHLPSSPAEAEVTFAAVLAAGSVPTLREIKRECHVGTEKARELRDHLVTVATRCTPVGA